MKRSKKLSLVLMGTILSANLTGCGEETKEEVSIFKNQQECIQGGFTAEQCAKMEADAKANSPKFSKREECEAEFGKEMCSGGTDSSGSFWMPALMGFMVGNMLGGGSGGVTNVTNNYIDDKDRSAVSGSAAAVNPATTGAAGGGGGAKSTPLVSNGLYNNPSGKQGEFKSATGRTVRPSPLGKAMVPRSTATFRGGFSGGARVSGFGG